MDFLKAYLSSKTKWSGFASLWPSFHSAKLELICIHEVWGYSKRVYGVVFISRDSLKNKQIQFINHLTHCTVKLETIGCRGVFRILILRVLSVNRIFPLRVLTAGAISLFLNITGAIAPIAPVLNTPLSSMSLD